MILRRLPRLPWAGRPGDADEVFSSLKRAPIK
jgi:hypothetical protein